MIVMSSQAARDGIARLFVEIAVAARMALLQTANFALVVAHGTTKFKDGPGASLRNSLMRGIRNPDHVFVKAGARHALFVEGGTRAHIIRAKLARGTRGPVAPGQTKANAKTTSGGLLRFQIAGRWIRVPFVKHPGTRATHFMLDARDRAESAGFHFVESGVSAAIRAAG